MHKCVVLLSANIINKIRIQDYSHGINQLYLRLELNVKQRLDNFGINALHINFK